MVERYIFFGHERWKMIISIHNANLFLLEMLKRNINRIIWVPEVTTFVAFIGHFASSGVHGGCSFGYVMLAATIKLCRLLPLAHDPLHFLTVGSRILDFASCQMGMVLRWGVGAVAAGTSAGEVHDDVEF